MPDKRQHRARLSYANLNRGLAVDLDEHKLHQLADALAPMQRKFDAVGA